MDVFSEKKTVRWLFRLCAWLSGLQYLIYPTPFSASKTELEKSL